MLPSNKLPDSVKFLKAVAGNGYIWLTGDGIYLKVEDNTYLPLQVDRQSRHPRRNVLKFQVGSPTRNFDSRAPFSDLRTLPPALLIDSPVGTKKSPIQNFYHSMEFTFHSFEFSSFHFSIIIIIIFFFPPSTAIHHRINRGT